jgi:hypothetical protein
MPIAPQQPGPTPRSAVKAVPPLRAPALPAAAVLGMMLLAGCTDPKAVRSFAELAPDPAKLHMLAKEYANAPIRMREIDLLDRLGPVPALDLTRPEQVKALDALHEVLVDYMKALGALAGENVVKTTDQVTALRDGLTKLKSASPGLLVTDDEISAGVSIAQLLANLLVSTIQQQALGEIIGTAEPDFQKLVKLEIRIIERGLRPEIAALRMRLQETGPVLDAINRDLASYLAGAGSGGRDDPKLRPRGAAATRAARLVLSETARAEEARLRAVDEAAEAYVKALRKIGEAHATLYQRRNDVLSRATFDAIKPLVQDAGAALKALAKL